MKMTKRPVLYKVPKFKVRCISEHKWTKELDRGSEGTRQRGSLEKKRGEGGENVFFFKGGKREI